MKEILPPGWCLKLQSGYALLPFQTPSPEFNPDCRGSSKLIDAVDRAQAKRHSVACVLSIYILSFLCGMRGPVAAAQFAQNLSQKELEILGDFLPFIKQKIYI